jgi:hypothetical protein
MYHIWCLLGLYDSHRVKFSPFLLCDEKELRNKIAVFVSMSTEGSNLLEITLHDYKYGPIIKSRKNNLQF